MKLRVFYNPLGTNEPEGWLEVGSIPVRDETEARERIAKLSDGKTRFIIEA